MLSRIKGRAVIQSLDVRWRFSDVRDVVQSPNLRQGRLSHPFAVTQSFIAVYQIAKGKIASFNLMFDPMDFMKQLGVVP